MAKGDRKEWGNVIEWGWIVIGSGCNVEGQKIPEERVRSVGYTSAVDIEDVKLALHADAAAYFPAGTRYELRRRMSTNYGRSHGMAWYRSETFDDVVHWAAEPGLIEEGGYHLVGRFTTPAAVAP